MLRSLKLIVDGNCGEQNTQIALRLHVLRQRLVSASVRL
jgi:hypothetical protein